MNAIWGQTTNGNGVYGQATGTGIGIHGSAPPAGFAGYFEGKVYISGGIVTGPQANNASAVKLADGSLGQAYTPSMPESYVEDVGRAQLVKGRATVSLDADVAGVIADGDYDVTLTLAGSG